MIQVKKLYKCQKAVIINKERRKENEYDVWYSGNKNDLFEASRTLKDTAFKLYMYLISNQEGYTFGLSRQDVIEKTGISSKSYDRAVTTLIELGYLVYTNQLATDGIEQAPLYRFYSRPNP